jgi:hypothetical protein
VVASAQTGTFVNLISLNKFRTRTRIHSRKVSRSSVRGIHSLRNEPTDPIRNRNQRRELFQSRVLQEIDVSVVRWELTIRQWLLDWQQPRPLPPESRNNTPPPRRATGRSFKQLQ